MRSSSTWVITAFLYCILLSDNFCHSKKLVVFAGPHKTSETSVEDFFYKYATGDTGRLPEQQALKDWIWPQLVGTNVKAKGTEPHQVFSHLVTDADNAALQEEILDGIEEHWDRANKGVIIGNEEFDRVGPNPYTHYDAVDAIQRVVKKLQVPNEDVTIVLLYKTPRVNQWLSIYNFTEGKYDSYTEYMCDPDSTDERWEAIDSAMNPLRIAEVFRNQDWKVALIDLEGVEQNKIDVEHVIGCEVLGGTCQDGWLENLVNKTFAKYTEFYDDANDKTLEALTKEQEDNLDQLFLLRDCLYDTLTFDDGVEVIYEYTIWNGCTDAPEHVPEVLTDTDLVLEAMRSQTDCNTEPISMVDILNGEVHELYGETSQNEDHALTIPIFFLVFIVAGVFLLVWIHRSSRREREQYGGTPTVEDRGGQRPPLSTII
jgi:hypothetical protein